MTSSIVDQLDAEIKKAVIAFWQTRSDGNGVLSGKTLHAFLEIVEKTVKASGLPKAEVYSGKNSSQLPGFFRPHKCWDAVVINNGKLIAAIEFKSQVGSIGNNFNNRTEEVLGSATDLKAAIEENAFGLDADIFTGYLILVEKSSESMATPMVRMNYFQVMPGFLLNEADRETKYVKNATGKYAQLPGISYLDRYDVMCKRLMLKGLYTGASVVAVPNEDHHLGRYEAVSPETSIITFLTKLQGHCQTAAAIARQHSANQA